MLPLGYGSMSLAHLGGPGMMQQFGGQFQQAPPNGQPPMALGLGQPGMGHMPMFGGPPQMLGGGFQGHMPFGSPQQGLGLGNGQPPMWGGQPPMYGGMQQMAPQLGGGGIDLRQLMGGRQAFPGAGY